LKQVPDLILLDWMLPKMQGIDVCINIRNSGSQVPILFLTAKDTVQETIDGLKAGANDYIKKPFSFDELLERIKIHFRSAKTNQILTLGSIKIICDKYEVYSNEELVQLTQKEYKLLHYLISNKGIVCSRNQIIEDVWDIHFEYDTGVIDVFMNAIRKKLHLSKDDERLKTIRGIGFIANDY
jgi:DNA-binding response OmpR family regulator